ncbi:MAG: hypothetical protein ACPGIH_13285, partial [Verrucomicrobiales bacterium]
EVARVHEEIEYRKKRDHDGCHVRQSTYRVYDFLSVFGSESLFTKGRKAKPFALRLERTVINDRLVRHL